MWHWNSWSMLYQAPFENAGPSVPVISAVFQTLHHFDNYTAWKLFFLFIVFETIMKSSVLPTQTIQKSWIRLEIIMRLAWKSCNWMYLASFYLPSGFECLGCNGVTFAGFPLRLCGPEMQSFYKTTEIPWVFTWLQELGFNRKKKKSTVVGLVIKVEALVIKSASHSKFVYKGNIVPWRERTEFPSVLFWLERNSSQRVNFTSQSQHKAYSASEVMHRPGCGSLYMNLLHATLREAAEVIVAEIV